MFRKWGLEASKVMVAEEDDTDATVDMLDQLRALNCDPYLALADETLRLISIFDDLRYDRADMDMISGPMRRRVIEKTAPLGFRQVSGGVIENRATNTRLLIPKFRALGASPFDALRDTPRRAQDFHVLTPTQAACVIVDRYPVDVAVDRIKTLVVKHPVNLLRLADFLTRDAAHQRFLSAVGHLRYVQRSAIEQEPLRTRRALR